MKSLILTIIFFSIGLLSSSAISAQVDTDTTKLETERWRPIEFRPDSGILLIQKPWHKRDKKEIEEFLDKKYPYKYELVALNDLDNIPKYSDKKIYRFILLMVGGYKAKRVGNEYSMRATVEYDFTDRLMEKDYFHTRTASEFPVESLKAVIKMILKNE